MRQSHTDAIFDHIFAAESLPCQDVDGLMQQTATAVPVDAAESVKARGQMAPLRLSNWDGGGQRTFWPLRVSSVGATVDTPA